MRVSVARFAVLPVIVAGMVAAVPAAAQAPAVPDSVYVIRAARLLDVETGAVGPAMIVVRGDRIEAVGSAIAIPAGARVIDVAGTVMPGLIDTHTHITSDPSGGYADRKLHEWPGYAAIVGVKNAQKTLMAGFTTVRNVGSDDWADIALRDAIRDGLVPGPRIVAAAYSLGITGGHCDTNGFRPDLGPEPGPEQGIANGIEQVTQAVRYQLKYGADLIKICATGGVLSAGDAVGVPQFTFDEVRAIVETAGFAGARVAAHAHGVEGIKTAVRAGVASIEHGSILDEEAIALMKEHGTYLVPTRMAFEAVVEGARSGALAPWSAQKALEIAPYAERSIGDAIRAGVKIAFGTDAGVFPHGENGGEFRLLVDAGMTPLQAIQAATTHAADLLGEHGVHLGAIKPGYYADIIGVSGDPLAEIDRMRSIGFIMKDGVVYRMPSRPPTS